jgi:hypothetical protein
LRVNAVCGSTRAALCECPIHPLVRAPCPT